MTSSSRHLGRAAWLAAAAVLLPGCASRSHDAGVAADAAPLRSAWIGLVPQPQPQPQVRAIVAAGAPCPALVVGDGGHGECKRAGQGGSRQLAADKSLGCTR